MVGFVRVDAPGEVRVADEAGPSRFPHGRPGVVLPEADKQWWKMLNWGTLLPRTVKSREQIVDAAGVGRAEVGVVDDVVLDHVPVAAQRPAGHGRYSSWMRLWLATLPTPLTF